VPGFNPGDPSADTSTNTEATLDIEMAVAMAPGLSKIVIYGAPYSSIPALLNEMANPTMGEPLPNQLSTSYFINYGINASNEQIFKQMAAQGQAFFVASGDNGAYFPVTRLGDFPPADSEYVTSVGGTMLTTTGPSGPWVSETAWTSSGGDTAGFRFRNGSKEP
jgi:subtilase family serine protease